MKNRFSGDLGTMPLYFNRGTLTFSKKIFQKEKTSLSTRRSKKGEEAATKQSGIVIDDLEDQMS
jgi:hypothetical protein